MKKVKNKFIISILLSALCVSVFMPQTFVANAATESDAEFSQKIYWSSGFEDYSTGVAYLRKPGENPVNNIPLVQPAGKSILVFAGGSSTDIKLSIEENVSGADGKALYFHENAAEDTSIYGYYTYLNEGNSLVDPTKKFLVYKTRIKNGASDSQPGFSLLRYGDSTLRIGMQYICDNNYGNPAPLKKYDWNDVWFVTNTTTSTTTVVVNGIWYPNLVGVSPGVHLYLKNLKYSGVTTTNQNLWADSIEVSGVTPGEGMAEAQFVPLQKATDDLVIKEFSFPVQSLTAANFAVDGGANITSVVPEGSGYRISFDKLDAYKDYTVSIVGVTDVFGQAISPITFNSGKEIIEESGLITSNFTGTENFDDFSFNGDTIDVVTSSGVVSGIVNSQSVALGDIWSLSSAANLSDIKGALVKTEGATGTTTTALKYFTTETNSSGEVNLGYPVGDASLWDEQTEGKYFVYEANIKSGDHNSSYFGMGSFGALAIDFSTGSAGFDSLSLIQNAFPLDQWVNFRYVIDRTGANDIHYAFFDDVLVGSKTEDVTVSNTIPFWGAISAGSGNDQAIYIDDISILVDGFSCVTLPHDQSNGYDPSEQMEIVFAGAEVKADSLSDMVITSSEDDQISIMSVEATNESGRYVITFNKTLDDYTTYTLDYSLVFNEYGLNLQNATSTFFTAGDPVVSLSCVLNKVKPFAGSSSITALSNGLVECQVTVDNDIIGVSLDHMSVVAMLMTGTTIDAVSYRDISLANGATEEITFGFWVTDATEQHIEITVKDSLNGNEYYADCYQYDASGYLKVSMTDSDVVYPVIELNTDIDKEKVYFRNVVFGENGVAQEVNQVTSGLIECSAILDLGAGESPYLICALKQNGNIVTLSYMTRSSTENGETLYSSALNVPEGEGFSISVYAWSDLKGTTSRIAKSTLS